MKAPSRQASSERRRYSRESSRCATLGPVPRYHQPRSGGVPPRGGGRDEHGLASSGSAWVIFGQAAMITINLSAKAPPRATGSTVPSPKIDSVLLLRTRAMSTGRPPRHHGRCLPIRQQLSRLVGLDLRAQHADVQLSGGKAPKPKFLLSARGRPVRNSTARPGAQRLGRGPRGPATTPRRRASSSTAASVPPILATRWRASWAVSPARSIAVA